MFKIYFIISLPFFIFLFAGMQAAAQQKTDSIRAAKIHKDTTTKSLLAQDTSAKKFNPKLATLRSALIPGWGQAYNKKYWKIPIIYGALGITTGIFFYNLKTYKLLRQAVIYRLDTIPSNDLLIDPRFRSLSTESIRTYRNEFRQNVDYSVLFFLLFWGLNIVDATVDAHLKAFDVSSDLSLKIKPGYNPYSNTAGVSFVFFFNNNRSKNHSSLR